MRTGSIEPAQPAAFGLLQVWWGDGKGKTTASLGMGMRAAGHGYRVHAIQFLKGESSIDDGRGVSNAIEEIPGYTIENTGHGGFSTPEDASSAREGIERVRDVIEATADNDPLTSFDLDSPPTEGVHMLILDEVLYAVNRGMISADTLVSLLENRPEGLEIVLTGGHEFPAYLTECVDLISHVENQTHPMESGYSARKGTEY